jgi:hypothetical protein
MMVDACNTARTQRSPAALARFQTLLCRISITLAHELIHVFTLFLRRQKSQHTPPRFSYGGYGTDVAGEAGRYWEYQVFGGYVDMRAGSSGEAIALRGNLAGRVWRLRSQLLGRFIAGDYSWLDEQLTESDHSYYREATDVMDAHKWVQRYADIFPQESPRKNSKQELSPSEVRELVELRSPQFPMFRISRGDLRRFIQNPALPVSASAA